MKMNPVQSSNIAAVGYDDDSKTLAVEFKNGGIYHYSDVSPETRKALLAADSIGKYLMLNIKGVYATARQEPVDGKR